MMYDVIAVPPSSGASQFTITLLPDEIVLGADGIPGIYAQSIETGLDGLLKPIMFLASILN